MHQLPAQGQKNTALESLSPKAKKKVLIVLILLLFSSNFSAQTQSENSKTHHLLRQRISAGELALGDNNFLELIDLAVEKLPLRVHELLERLHGTPNLYLREILHCRPQSFNFQNGM